MWLLIINLEKKLERVWVDSICEYCQDKGPCGLVNCTECSGYLEAF